MLWCGRALIFQGGTTVLQLPSFRESHEDRPAKENGTWGFPRQEISKTKRLTTLFWHTGGGKRVSENTSFSVDKGSRH